MEREDNNQRLSAKEAAAMFSDPQWAERFPPLLTLNQAADLLQVPKQTLYDWSSRGLLAGCKVKVGKHLRLHRDRLVQRFFNEENDDKRRR
jgi:excisionase family DNA binding protein